MRFAESFVGSRAVAEEVVQDSWLAVVRGVDRFEGRSTISTWLYHIVANRARTAGVREHRHVQIIDDQLADRFDRSGEWALPLVVWSDQVEDRLVAQRLAARVRELLPKLATTHHQAVLLHDIEGLSSSNTANVLGISEGNLRVVLHRARTILRGYLEREMVSR